MASAGAIYRILSKEYPDACCELDFKTPYQLLVATVLSAQCTDVPANLDELVQLPGVGRKTANVVLGNAFGIPGLTVDTHFGRLSRRFGWTNEDDPVKVERDVAKLIPKKEWTHLSHRLIWHGRRICHSRKPACGACPLAKLCPSFGIGERDPQLAQGLVKSKERW